SVAKGTTFVVDVAAVAVLHDLYGGGFELTYDPAVIEYVSVDTAASALVSAKDAVALRGGRPGIVVFGRTREGVTPGSDVRGSIARFTFRALAAGRTSVALAEPAFLDGAGAEIAIASPRA